MQRFHLILGKFDIFDKDLLGKLVLSRKILDKELKVKNNTHTHTHRRCGCEG